MTTAALAPTLRDTLLAKVLAWIDANPGGLIDYEWALRADVEPEPMQDYLSLPALVCVAYGLELGWNPLTVDEIEDFYPPQVTDHAHLVYDPAAMEWQYVAVVARHLLGLDSQEATDLFEIPDAAGVVTAIHALMNGDSQ
jgi:hypothetical protein